MLPASDFYQAKEFNLKPKFHLKKQSKKTTKTRQQSKKKGKNISVPNPPKKQPQNKKQKQTNKQQHLKILNLLPTDIKLSIIPFLTEILNPSVNESK